MNNRIEVHHVGCRYTKVILNGVELKGVVALEAPEIKNVGEMVTCTLVLAVEEFVVIPQPVPEEPAVAPGDWKGAE